MVESDVTIIGGGPTGAIAGGILSKQGFNVNIIEKQKFPRFVIGESLLPRCNEILEKAGMIDAVKQAGFMVKGGAVFQTDDHNEEIFNFNENMGQKWKSTYQVKREDFDEILLNEAVRYGAKLHAETEVKDFDQATGIIRAVGKNGENIEIKSRFTLDASGYGRLFPKLLGLDEPSHLVKRRAVFGRIKNDNRPEGELEGYIYIYIHGNNDAWIWIIPFSDGITSIGIVCSEEYYQSFGLSDEEFLDRIMHDNPNARERLKNAEKVVPINSIIGYSAAVKQMFGENYAMAGNATEFLDPVFSSGVTLALESGSRAAELVSMTLKGDPVDWVKDYHDYMMKGINVFREFVLAWYDGRLHQIFFSTNKQVDIKKAITSVLAGFVWDEKNMFVKDPKKSIDTVLAFIKNRD